jgi:hypothetical protein
MCRTRAAGVPGCNRVVAGVWRAVTAGDPALYRPNSGLSHCGPPWLRLVALLNRLWQGQFSLVQPSLSWALVKHGSIINVWMKEDKARMGRMTIPPDEHLSF